MSDPETTYRGVPWRRDGEGRISFYDTDGGRWVRWAPGVDAPPLPPGWGAGTAGGSSARAGAAAGVAGGTGASGRLGRPAWTSRWRLLPLILTVVVLVIAAVQALHSSGNQTANEAKASAALLGRCLAQNGTAGGHPSYSAKAVDCSSPHASVKVVAVVSTTPGSPVCPAGTAGVILAHSGVRYPHVLCVQPVGTG